MLHRQRTADRAVRILACLVLTAGLGACVIEVGGGPSRVSTVWGRTPTVNGSGVERTEERELAPFERVQLDTVADLRITIGEVSSVRVTTDTELLFAVRTHVEDGELVISHESGSYRHGVEPRVEITMPRLKGFSLNGSGDIDIAGLDERELDVSVSGSGRLRADGRCDVLRVAVSGWGRLEFFELVARSADVKLSGGGRVDLHAHESLSAKISGSGEVRYRGHPSVRSKISGSGSVAPDAR